MKGISQEMYCDKEWTKPDVQDVTQTWPLIADLLT